MMANLVMVLVGAALWFAVATDAKRFQARTGERVWGLTHRTWAWIVAITFVGLVPYLIGRTVTARRASPPVA